MERTLLNCMNHFGSLYGEYERKKNNNLRLQWELIKDKIHQLRKIYTVKVRAELEANKDIFTLVKELLKVEQEIHLNLPENFHFQENELFFSSKPLKDLVAVQPWNPVSYFTYMKIMDFVEVVLNEVAFYYGVFRNELEATQLTKKIPQMKKDCSNIRYSLWLAMNQDQKLDNEVGYLYFSILDFEKILYESPEKFSLSNFCIEEKTTAIDKAMNESMNKLSKEEIVAKIGEAVDSFPMPSSPADENDIIIDAAIAESIQELDENMPQFEIGEGVLDVEAAIEEAARDEDSGYQSDVNNNE